MANRNQNEQQKNAESKESAITKGNIASDNNFAATCDRKNSPRLGRRCGQTNRVAPGNKFKLRKIELTRYSFTDFLSDGLPRIHGWRSKKSRSNSRFMGNAPFPTYAKSQAK